MYMTNNACMLIVSLVYHYSLASGRHFSQLLSLPRDVNPEANMSFCQIADYYGYLCEEYLHKVETADGFLLTLHRVNGRKGDVLNSATRPPVFVQHGLLGDSAMWIMNLPNETLPLLLSDAGYDVWLGNSRGNTYSKKHKTLTEDQEAFWAWSWDEMAQYDLPASIDFVLNVTGYEKMHYIGHSQGTLMAFIHLAYTQSTKISHLIAVGPVFTVAHMKSPLKLISPFSRDVDFIMKVFGIKEFLPSDWVIKWLAQHLCDRNDPLHFLCADVLFIISGFDVKQLNQSRLDVIISHSPAGTSVQNMMHFAQMNFYQKTIKYDYGSAEANFKHYQQNTPPAYDISNLTTPVSLFWAENDWLADPQDVQYLTTLIKTIKNNVYIPDWNHLDFVWAMDSKAVLVDRVISIIDNDFKK